MKARKPITVNRGGQKCLSVVNILQGSMQCAGTITAMYNNFGFANVSTPGRFPHTGVLELWMNEGKE